MALFHFVWGVEQKDRQKPKRPSMAVMGGYGEGLQRPCESKAFLDRSGSKALPHALLLTARISKAADSDRPACWLTSPSGRKYITHAVKLGDSSVGAGMRGVTEKGNTFYDDVMQAVFSFFFSFLLLPSLEVLWTILLSVPLSQRLCPHTL